MKTHLCTFPLFAAVLVACSGGATADDASSRAAEDLVACAKGPTVRGVDVSTYEGQVDWSAAKSAGIGFGIARVSDGTAHPDDQFARNWKVLQADGLVRGVYQFFRPGVDPLAQATLLLDALRANGGLASGDLPPILDWETTDGVDDATARARAQTWLDAIERGTGRRPMIYTAPFMSSTIGSGFGAYPLWVANYQVSCPSVPAGWASWTIWQSSESGSVAGIGGAVDINEFNGSMADLAAFIARSHTAPADCHGQKTAAGTLTCNRAGIDAQLAGVEACVKTGGGAGCFTTPSRYPYLLCGDASGGGYTCDVDALFQCLCFDGGPPCVERSCTRK